MKRLVNKRTLWMTAVIAAILLPLTSGGYTISVLTLICLWTIMAVSLNLIFGYTGQLSLGHSAFLGLGAYSMGLLTTAVGLPFWPAFVASIAVAGLAGFLVGIPSLRLRGAYFVLVTLGFALVINVPILIWDGLTGGANGIRGIPRPPTIPLPLGAELDFSSPLSMYYLALFFLVLVALANHRLVRSLVGRTFIAISQNEELAQSIGIDTMRNKLLSFTLSASIAGIAGALYATNNSVITPSLAHFTEGMNAVVYLVVGGAGSLVGPFVGPLVLVTLPEVLQMVPEVKTLLNGVLLVVFVLFLPTGIVGGLKAIKVSLSRRSKGTLA